MSDSFNNTYLIKVNGINDSLPLPQKGEIIIGRSDPALSIFPDIDLTSVDLEMGISRRHVRIIINDDKLTLEDLDSTNGTYVDLQKVVPRVPLSVREGQEIRLGNVILRIEKLST